MSNPTSFTLEANPGTDIWRKPPTTNVWNGKSFVPPVSLVPKRWAPLAIANVALLDIRQSQKLTGNNSTYIAHFYRSAEEVPVSTRDILGLLDRTLRPSGPPSRA
ncbi:hypothetical protein RRF57_012330 [Xylaria bambusicola]|uniref:Uncharacterized protein n=1 Tax=Xylaria bambusicola TaxID=326684 RepID=A0AAN7UZD8_9PEZI